MSFAFCGIDCRVVAKNRGLGRNQDEVRVLPIQLGHKTKLTGGSSTK